MSNGVSFARKHTAAVLALVLAVMVLAVYWRTTGYALIALDDELYITKNPMVVKGITVESIWAAFFSRHEGLQHLIPLTWISYMVDVEVSGLDPGGFHRTNVILFLASSLLLFFFLRFATGSAWKSFFAVALWALHPLRVESVAWVAERKDVLSGLFFILALWSHLLYARTGKIKWYAAVAAFGLLGLLAKPIVVVLPVALLLLDFWPLGRFEGGKDRKENLANLKRLVLEKTPVIAFSAVSVVITLYTQVVYNPVAQARSLPHGLANASASYWIYLGRTFYPADLMFSIDTPVPVVGAVFAVASFAVLTAVSYGAYMLRNKVPELTFGWFWFLLLLLPNSGVVAVGMQNFADRFTFLSHIGLLSALVWGAARLAGRIEHGEKMMMLPGVTVIAVLTVFSVSFTGYWKNSYTLFGHIDEIYGGRNPLALVQLASASMNDNNPRAALSYLETLERTDPEYPKIKQNKVVALYKLGRYDEALAILQRELAVDPYNESLKNMISTVMKAKAAGRQ